MWNTVGTRQEVPYGILQIYIHGETQKILRYVYFFPKRALHVFLHTDIENGIPGNCNFLKLLEFYNKWTNSQRNLHDVSDVYCNAQ